jgi:formylglycine-generating enzyme required for sulfatase activity
MAEVADLLELYGPSKKAAAAPDSATLAAAASAIAAAPKPEAPSPTAGIPGMQPQRGSSANKNLIPLIAVAAGVILGVGGWYISTHGGGGGGDNVVFNPDGGTTKTNTSEVSSEDIERKVQLEVEAMRRKYEEETKKLELEKKKQEEELEKRRQALAATTAAAKKAQEEAEARQRLAEEEARKRQADAEARQQQADADAKRLVAEREALKQKEEEMKKAAIAAAQQNESPAAKAERLRREKEYADQQAALLKMQAEMEKARLESEAIKAAAEVAAKKAAEEKAAFEAAAKKALEEKAAAELAAKKAAEDEVGKKAELEKKIAEAERQRTLAEAENRRKIEEAARRAALDRELKMAKLTDEQRKAEELKKAAADKERKEKEAQLLAQSSVVGSRPGSGLIWHNTLGMRMVPLGDIYVCAWETRLQDFEEFTRVSRFNAGTSWKSPGFKQTPTHPVVNVNYDDALAFCNWLTAKERTENIIGGDQIYRLPTDAEWSRAAELANESGATPEERSDRIQGQYPWGNVWPPPPGAGNYSDGVSFDRFDSTAPVASFMPNKLGIHDLGGNVWEWCMDWGDAGQKQRVLRGGSFFGYIPGTLASSHRLLLDGKDRRYDNGFRVVLAK